MSSIKQQFKVRLPWAIDLFRSIRGSIRAQYYKLFFRQKPSFVCPICNYKGPFANYNTLYTAIKHTQCPKCELYERHRLQFLVFSALEKQYNFSNMSMLHFAPETLFKKYFKSKLLKYHTADLESSEVNYRTDICKLPLADCCYDIVFASHVLEHVESDDLAISEISRILRKDGFAVLPVPVVSPKTINYSAPNPYEFGHVRAIGQDYFEKYSRYFSKVTIWDSKDFSDEYQLHTYEDRSNYPNQMSPERVGMPGEKHPDFVPVCIK